MTVSTGARLKALREQLKKDNLDAFLIPSEDAHQSEYAADAYLRRHWISGFNGSAGFAVVTMTEAALFTDGRYFLQAEDQLDENWVLMKQGLSGVPTWQDYLIQKLPAHSRVGLDASLTLLEDARDLRTRLKTKESTLVSVKPNPVDVVWADRPALPTTQVFIQPLEYAGQSFEKKLEDVRQHIQHTQKYGLIVSALDEVAWLFNLRGSDVVCNPVFYAYALITEEETILYIDENKLSAEVKDYLKGVIVKPYLAVFDDLHHLKLNDKKLLIDMNTSLAIADAVGEDNVREERSFLNDAKSIKNETEINGMRACHIRDGAALVKYFSWLEKQLKEGRELSEVEAADHLEALRAQQKDYMGLSFPTISATGPNGAIIHYEPERDTCKIIDPKQIYLCDSGAQYRDGTTDVTRSYHFGEPTEYEKECFTAVLKGHIALDKAIFPVGTTGYLLDPLARMPLWQIGLDYRHGTGHGVGSFLYVHEGPHGIGVRAPFNNSPLSAGMTVTDEPGYYEDGKFGIRIENILIIHKHETKHHFGDKTYLGFEHLTMVPMGQKLMNIESLCTDDKQWINEYHQQCLTLLSPLVEDDEVALAWLKRETTAI
ncbi:peptidase M24, structural domain-containing protein [Pilobolus umbonatus]|nr:peptidase M24, structural domain-containing protein [Pilobolus umbonatus]